MITKLYFLNKTKTKVNLIRTFNAIEKTAIEFVNNDNRTYEVSLTIIDDKFIHKLNKKYRNIDRPTDVLSFAFEEADTVECDEIPVCLGDIFISIETAKRQAKEYGHSLKRELSFLFAHGLLHLLGYDHMKKEDEKVMFKLQDKILNKLDIRR